MRAQVTIFVILGLVILVVIGFGLFLQNTLGKQSLETQAENTVQAITEDQSVTFFVQSCLESVTDEAVKLIGFQGGVIYEDQGGLTPRTEFPVMWLDKDIPYEVALGIKKSDVPTPSYPLLGRSVTTQEAPIFGTNVMRKLCDYNGPNAPHITTGSAQSCKIFTSYNYADNTTITVQEELEHYVEALMPSCVDLTTFEVVYQRDITTGTPETEVIMTENAFVVNLAYPVTISFQNESVTSHLTFTYESHHPLQEIYNFLFDLADQETRIWNHTIENRSTNATYFVPGLQASWVPLVGVQGKDYKVLQVLDTRNLLDGKPYRYNVVVENRRPVIDYFNKTEEDWHQMNFALNNADKQTLEIKPLIFDPDDETPKLQYEGWKETCEIGSSEQGLLGELSSFGQALHLVESADDPSEHLSGLQLVRTCDEGLSPTPALSSGDEIILTQSDFGFHHVNITVIDVQNNNLIDWQDVFVLVKPHT